MKVTAKIFLIGGFVLGIFIFLSAISRSDQSGTIATRAGAAALGIPVALVGVIISRLIETKSPEARQKAVQFQEEIDSMNTTDFAAFLTEDLCHKLDIRPDQANLNLVEALRVTPGEINILLQNLQIDDGLPVTSDDSGNIQCVNDIVELIDARRGIEKPS